MELSPVVSSALKRLASSKIPKLTLLCLVTFHFVRKLRNKKKLEYRLLSKCADAQKERDETIEWAREEAAKVTTIERTRIEAMNFDELRDALQNGTVSCETAIRVFYGLAIRAHEKTNCLTRIIKVSLDEAREMDKKALSVDYVKPPLFGIPISIKDSNEIRGQRSTWGLAKMIDHFATEDSYQVGRLRMEGMISFCQTNVPTTCLTYNCSNSVYGTTNCPFNRERTSGGSSGGEGALIGAGGSLIGLGSDIGGSIRIPAAYSGCCGFKPSATRCSTIQIPEPIPMRPFAMPTEGPLAKDPHAIVAIMRSMWSNSFISNEDPLAVPVDFREELFKEGKPLRIGYYTSDGYIDPLPGNQRVVREAVELLKSKGHVVVPFELEEIAAETARGAFGTVFADGGRRMAEKLLDEPLSPLMGPLKGFVSMGMWTKKAIGWFSKLRGDQNTADFFLCQSDSAMGVQTGIDRVFACRKTLVKKMKDEEIDIILCPPTVSPAMPHSLPNQIPFTAILATLMWNVMDFPAGVVTTSKWTEADEKALESYEEKGIVEAGIKRGCRNSVGLPLSVQLVAPPFRDELVLRGMVDLYDAMKKGR